MPSQQAFASSLSVNAPVPYSRHTPRMHSLIHAELSHPAKLDGKLELPRKSYGRIPSIGFPVVLGILRIFTAIILLINFLVLAGNLNSPYYPRYEHCSKFFYFLTAALFLYEFIFLTMPYEPVPFKDQGKYATFSHNCHAWFVRKWLLIIAGSIIILVITREVSWKFVTVLIVHYLAEKCMRNQYSNYYEQQFTAFEDGLVEDLKEMFGKDHKLSQPVPGELGEVSSDIENKFWEGVAIDSRHQSIVPKLLYSKQNEDGLIDYFVDWTSYTSITEGFEEDHIRMCTLAEKCKELRSDLMRQNELIVQCREKFYGSNTDSSDIQQVPHESAIPASWIQERADCIFTSSKGSTNLYINMTHFREMAQYAFLVRASIPSLENEKALLKKDLKKRKDINNELMLMVLKVEFTNKDDFVII